MTDPIARTFSEADLQAFAARYISQFYGAVPTTEPERTQWYQSYGLLVSFVHFLWSYDFHSNAVGKSGDGA